MSFFGKPLSALDWNRGACDLFALAMNRVTGLPMHALIETAEKDGSRALVHAFCLIDSETMVDAVGSTPLVQLDILPNRLSERAAVLLPTASWAEKAGTFENVNGVLQCFERAIEPLDYCKGECQLALDLVGSLEGKPPARFDASDVRARMATLPGLEPLAEVAPPVVDAEPVQSDLVLIDL